MPLPIEHTNKPTARLHPGERCLKFILTDNVPLNKPHNERISVLDLVTSSGEVAEDNKLNIPRPKNVKVFPSGDIKARSIVTKTRFSG